MRTIALLLPLVLPIARVATLTTTCQAPQGSGDRNEIRLYTNEVMTENLSYYPNQGFTETHRAMDAGYHRVYFSRPVTPDGPPLA